MTLGIESFRKATLRRESVSVPEMDGDVFVRVLTLQEVREIQRAQKDMEPLDLYPKLVRMASVNEDGSPLFGASDVALIEGLPWPVVEAIAHKALDISGMTPENGGPKGD